VQSRVGLLISQEAHLTDSSTLVLLSRNVTGPVHTVVDTRGAMAAGLVAGVAVGLLLWLGSWVSRR
jgi:hypothetical protein